MDMMEFPIKFGPTGLKKLTEGTHEYYSQLLSIVMRTEPSTHPFYPTFGASDPAFTTIDRGLFVLNAARYVPEVLIKNVSIADDAGGAGRTDVSVTFEIRRN